jgi:hypothetical protein
MVIMARPECSGPRAYLSIPVTKSRLIGDQAAVRSRHHAGARIRHPMRREANGDGRFVTPTRVCLGRERCSVPLHCFCRVTTVALQRPGRCCLIDYRVVARRSWLGLDVSLVDGRRAGGCVRLCILSFHSQNCRQLWSLLAA